MNEFQINQIVNLQASIIKDLEDNKLKCYESIINKKKYIAIRSNEILNGYIKYKQLEHIILAINTGIFDVYIDAYHGRAVIYIVHKDLPRL
jgi:hypothetical protein